MEIKRSGGHVMKGFLRISYEKTGVPELGPVVGGHQGGLIRGESWSPAMQLSNRLCIQQSLQVKVMRKTADESE